MRDEAIEEQHVAASHADDVSFTGGKGAFRNAKVVGLTHFMRARGFPATWDDFERTGVFVHVRQRNPARHAYRRASGLVLWPRDILMPRTDPRRE